MFNRKIHLQMVDFFHFQVSFGAARTPFSNPRAQNPEVKVTTQDHTLNNGAWKTTFLLGFGNYFRCELLVSGSLVGGFNPFENY